MTPTPITIRKMTIQDALDINSNGLLDTLASLSDSPPITNPYTALKLFNQATRNEAGHIFVAVTTTDQLVGHLKLMIDTKLSHGGACSGHIEDVAVHPDYQGRGIAKQLMAIAIGTAQRLGCYKIVLDCRAELFDFYDKFGFAVHEYCLRLNL